VPFHCRVEKVQVSIESIFELTSRVRILYFQNAKGDIFINPTKVRQIGSVGLWDEIVDTIIDTRSERMLVKDLLNKGRYGWKTDRCWLTMESCRHHIFVKERSSRVEAELSIVKTAVHEKNCRENSF